MSSKLSKIPVEYWPTIDELPGDLSQLARVIEEVVPCQGVRIVLHLVDEYRSTSVYFHNLDALDRLIRDRWIIERYDKGEKVRDIARDVDLCERRVWDIVGKVPGEDKQLRLF